MKCLLTVHQFFPDHVTGTEVLTLSVARELRARGHDVRILTGFPADDPIDTGKRTDTYEYDGFTIYRIKQPASGLGAGTSLVRMRYDDPEAADYARRILEEYQPEVVHAFHLDRLGAGLIDVVKSAGLPMFMTPTDFWALCPTAQLLLPDGSMCAGPEKGGANCVKHLLSLKSKGKSDRAIAHIPAPIWNGLTKVAKRAHIEVAATIDRPGWIAPRINQLDGLLVPNKMMQERLLQNGIKQDLMHLARFGIRKDSSAGTPDIPAQMRRRDPSKKVRIGYIGTLAPHKGCHVLLNAALELPADQAEFHIYGNPDQFPDYMAELRETAQGRSNITFHPPFPNAQIDAVFADLDVLVVPSVWFENTPLVIYSAQKARCPVVVSDLPGLTEVIVHAQNGLSFPANDSKALKTQLSRVIDEPDLLETLSRGAVMPRSIQDYTDDVLKMWQSAMQPTALG